MIPVRHLTASSARNEHVKAWNEELLCVTGYLARMIYDHEMTLIKTLCPSRHTSTTLQSKCLRSLQFFTFRKSTPNHRVSEIISDAFFNSASQFPIMSSVGILSACEIRDYDEACATFIKTVPMLPLSIATDARAMMDILRKKGNSVKPIDFPDLMDELAGRVFEEDEMVSCLKWVINHASPLMAMEARSSFLAIAQFSHEEPGRLIQLSSIRTVPDVNSSFILPGFPLPDHTLPLSIAKNLSVEDLTKLFSWTPLSITEWLANLASCVSTLPAELNLAASYEFAKNVFEVVANSWGTLSEPEKGEIRTILRRLTCVPTQRGMKHPEEVYLSRTIASAFPELPIVKLEVSGPLQDMLKAVVSFEAVSEDVH